MNIGAWLPLFLILQNNQISYAEVLKLSKSPICQNAEMLTKISDEGLTVYLCKSNNLNESKPYWAEVWRNNEHVSPLEAKFILLRKVTVK